MTDGQGVARITGKTKILFILADPVAHVRGSALFNDYFQRNDIDASFSPIQISSADLGKMVETIRLMKNVAGFGITIPHKISVIDHLDAVTARARHIGAVNFVRREPDGELIGENTDGIGFVMGLARNGVTVAGKRVLQIGAGGAGRAIAFALAEAGAAEIRIANRSAAKAANLAEAVGAAYPQCSVSAMPEAIPAGMDLIVNTSSLGMHEGDRLPVDPSSIASSSVVADVIMAPDTTPLLEQAEARGCKIIRGKEMLIDQAQLVRDFMTL